MKRRGFIAALCAAVAIPWRSLVACGTERPPMDRSLLDEIRAIGREDGIRVYVDTVPGQHNVVRIYVETFDVSKDVYWSAIAVIHVGFWDDPFDLVTKHRSAVRQAIKYASRNQKAIALSSNLFKSHGGRMTEPVVCSIVRFRDKALVITN